MAGYGGGAGHVESAVSSVGHGRGVLDEIATVTRRRRRSFRVQFVLVWLAILALLGWVFWSTGNVDLEFIREWGPFILQGAPITVLVSVTSIVLAVGLAILGALGRLSGSAIPFAVASFYVSLVRGTPLLIQILFVYLALPQVGIVLSPLVGGILALGFNYGAYMTEIFRAGIQAVPRGQIEAARALGMPEGRAFRRIVAPQAFRVVIPAIGNEFIVMIKDSALISIVSVQELLWRAQTAGQRNFATLQTFLIAALVYWMLTIAFSFFQERLERRMARGDR
jgi:polar amino acid transport system permease protein